MIELKNVTKIYKINDKKECKAINDVSVILPDSGMIFIIGKSGSGKSTLLNLIGGLDTPTSGTIISDKLEISSFNQTELTKYRSSYIGFIFQDYHILENLTVTQNINLALDIQNQEDDEKVDEILRVVDLTEYVDRYPSELSGGQQQRIAVARALVKDSPLILCDEPTGNLDKNTSQQILDLLKRISQHKLVIVVSHNMVEANNYADRIIELYDGKIVRDRSRSANYSNEFRIIDDVIYIPHYRDLTEDELNIINDELKNNKNAVFKQIGNRFIETKVNVIDKDPFILKSSNISRKNSSKLFRSFFKGQGWATFFSVFIASVLLSCFAIFQSFLSFDANLELSKSLTKHDIYGVPLQKGEENYDAIGMSTVNVVYDEEVQAFYDSGFDGNVYKKYGHTLPITAYSNSIEKKGKISVLSNLTNFYLRETFGVINCSESFLSSIYGIEINGKKELQYLAISENPKPYGIYITDYVADSMKVYRKLPLDTPYEKFLGEYIYNKNKYGYINGVIKTNYQEKHEYLLEQFKEILANPDNDIDNQKIKQSPEFSSFVVETMNFLGYGYSFEPNFLETTKTIEYRTWVTLGSTYLELDSEHIGHVSFIKLYDHSVSKKQLSHDEIILDASTCSKIFPNISQSGYQSGSLKLKLRFYENYGTDKIIYEKEFKIVAISGSTSIINLEENMNLREHDVVAYGIYLDNHNNIGQSINIATEMGYIVCSPDATKLSTINHVLQVFGKFFYFIEILFLILCVVFILNIGIASVKKNKYDIGVLKAIGTSNFDIIKIYARQTILTCIAICIVTNIGIYIGTYLANLILVGAFETILNTTFFELRLIAYIPAIVIEDMVWIIVICLISFIIPQIMLLRIKPNDIIRAKE